GGAFCQEPDPYLSDHCIRRLAAQLPAGCGLCPGACAWRKLAGRDCVDDYARSRLGDLCDNLVKVKRCRKQGITSFNLIGWCSMTTSTQIQSQPKTEFSIHPATRPGHVALTVASLENQVAFYQ